MGVFGGGLKLEENPLQAVMREAKEELSYTLKNPKLIWQQDYTIEYTNESGVEYIFTEVYDNSSLSLNEGGGMAWKSLEEALASDMNDIDRRVLVFLQSQRSHM